MSINAPSKGEKKIMEILKQNRIIFKREVSFEDLNGLKNAPLRFDFAIYKKGKLICLLEYDGSPHFQFTKHFHKDIFAFRKAQEWDRRKNAYCLARKIPLIRIPYWDYDKLDFKKIFCTPEYVVKNKYHNDFLINRGVKK